MTPEEARKNSLERAHKFWELNKEKYFTEFNPMTGPNYFWWVDFL
jgi:hypothetical protein